MLVKLARVDIKFQTTMILFYLTPVLLTTTIVVVCSSAHGFHSRIRVKGVYLKPIS